MSTKPRYQQKPLDSNDKAVQSQKPSQPYQQGRPYNPKYNTSNNNNNNKNNNYNNNNNNNNNYNNNNNNNNNYNKRFKYQSKQTYHKSKYGFEYDQQKITFNTQIPQLPQKLKNKPDQSKYTSKITQIQSKVSELKKQRKIKKQTYKNGNQHFTKQIQQQQYKIKLAKSCLIILNNDKDQLELSIEQVQNKLLNHKRKIDLLNKPIITVNNKKKIQQMNYQELIRQQAKVLNLMSTQDLKKSEEVQLNNKLNKIAKRKIQLPKQQHKNIHHDQQKYQEIQSHKQSIERLRKTRQIMSDKLTDILQKIQSITDNIIDFEENIEDIHQKQRTTDNSILLEQAAQLKQKIYVLWDQLAEIKTNYQKKLYQYQEEQQKIKYIKWAEDLKNKKKQQWEEEKQLRKKIRNKEKQQKKNQDNKKQGNTTQNKIQQKKPQYQRKKINKNQKQIDSCAFLIQYCKDLSSANNQNNQQSNAQKQVNIQQALKKGQWAKMKNIQVIQSKKKKAQQQVQQKHHKKKQVKPTYVQSSDRFSHTYFVAQIFDSVKVLPPSKPQELQKTIAEIEDKLQYFLAHPDEETGKSQHLIEGKDNKQKSKGFRKINTEEFPALR